jgi:hypothetical protein
MILICDKCGKERETKIGILVGDQKICVKCLACFMVDNMEMPDMNEKKMTLHSRVELIEQKMKEFLDDKFDQSNRN